MHFKTFCFAVTGIVLVGCMETTSEVETDPLKSRLSGMTAVHEAGTTITLHPDGRVTGQTAGGSEIAGAWDVRNGQYCRTLSSPEQIAGTSCQDVVFEGKQVSFIRADGTPSTFTMQE